MEREQFVRLADRILSGQASDEEVARYVHWFNSQQKGNEVFIKDADLKRATIYTGIQNNLHKPANNNIGILLRLAAAAVIVLVMGITAYIILKPQAPANEVFAKNDIKPGGNKAILTLSGGKQIVLDDADIGQIASEQGVAIRKTKSGQLVYQFSGAAADVDQASLQMNTISTPRGGQYQVILPDGTKVWLNAASSLKFPSRFSGNNRDVTLTGEGYFEVAKNKTKPFHVNSSTQQVEVLGTHFDISTYDDEDVVKTTLLEGSVHVTSGQTGAMLKPGQQSILTTSTHKIAIDDAANIDEIVGWKNGLFVFNQTDVPAMMRQISRWYDIDIVYEGKIPDDKFTGTLSRSVNLSKVLKLIQFTGINFKVEGRKLIIR